MSFNNFCNICFIKEHIIKLCLQENESILNILTAFTSCQDKLNGIIYLCINCCNKLEEYNKFRELFLTNFVRFRYLYNEYKKNLELCKAPDIETKLKAFVDVNVERENGTPLIENYVVAHASRSNSTCNVDINYKESDGEFTKIYVHELLNKNDLTHGNISFKSENNYSNNEPQICQVKCENDSFNEDQDNINGNCIYVKDEPNPDRFEESQDPLASDTVANVIPYEADDHNSDVSFNPGDCVTNDSTDEEESTSPNKTTSDTVCNVCHEFFLSNSDLEVHMSTHTGEKHYNCDKCHKTFTDPAKIIKHKRVHSVKKPYKCDECDMGFTRRLHLNTHKRIHTGEKPYKCGECGMVFTQLSNLNRHKSTHTGEKPYKCDECAVGFTKKTYLNRHKLIHTGKKPYKCDECGLQCRHPCRLKIHKRVHTVKKPYKCDECGLRYTLRCNLNRHKQTHTGEKPYKCAECGLGFTRRDVLLTHNLIHTGDRSFSCDECHKTFTQNAYLKKHKRRHAVEKLPKYVDTTM